MNASERRIKIQEILKATKEPISARKLAEQFQVSRQIIVGDIALLRAEGHEIVATPRGYLSNEPDEKDSGLFVGKVVCQHSEKQTEEELRLIIDHGGEVLNVEIEHPFYGVLAGELRIQSRYDIQCFLKEMGEQQSKMLSSLTHGIHLHTIRSVNEETFLRIKSALREAGILYE
ncbi:transcription repressor NadR [Jeotgalibaca caeni]|uniref:transcription repressor NadR n=1 Tax=Jeotgalibaca caeni TaxID=3028623 RepID=UPI00237D5E90|nr:transcription repressor NadR [Jeotgalibaca caeni]MDE1548985.1 transcription repressor NadR [Jeotgalibaca caeni]